MKTKDESNPKPIKLLLVDDDPVDVELTMEVMNLCDLKLKVDVVDDGVKAIDYLYRHGDYRHAERPDLILLDLNMPRKNGHEVLEIIKRDELLKSIPVVVLTTSNNDQDIREAYARGASCFITKPVGLEEFQKVMESFESFWLTCVQYPE